MQRDSEAAGLTVVRDDSAVPDAHRGAVAAIGNFDGVHLGHQALLAEAKRIAAPAGRTAAVVTFEPHPRDFFRPEQPGFRLTGEAGKLSLLARFGVRLAVVLRFDEVLARTSAAHFVELLASRIGLSHVVVGADFHFGRGREGNPAVLEALGRSHGLGTTLCPAVTREGVPVSSSRIRDALAAGDVPLANDLLGYRWFASGTVAHGAKRGRTLGYPTANIELPAGCRLAYGIYAVRAADGSGLVWGGVASFGSRPTFDDGPPVLETYLFDFSGDLYGRTLTIEFIRRLRPELRFADAPTLVRQMDTDAAQARTLAVEPVPAGISTLR